MDSECKLTPVCVCASAAEKEIEEWTREGMLYLCV